VDRRPRGLKGRCQPRRDDGHRHLHGPGGGCRDFSHLLIARCRAADIPARAVSAYAWRLDPPDLHAVAEVYVGDRWRLVDATGLAPIRGLVRVATGRDAADIAFMTVFGAASLVEQRFSINPC
jgi:transglutaminase-like putative cysteine protease